MPHVILDYSANLDGPLDIAALCDHLRIVGTGIDAMPTPGIRVRAHRAEAYSIADGGEHHGYIDIVIRMRGGRTEAQKDDIATRMFAAARDFTAAYMARHSLALSLEVQDIDPAFSPKTGTIRDHLKDTP